ncbi:glycoside hydrolase family 43 protein [Bifidobacterium longum]|nr:glycoside hydrolase family 43 protein [Bifidobacterium longum]
MSMIAAMMFGLSGCSAQTASNSPSQVRDGSMITDGIDSNSADPWIIRHDGEYYYCKVMNDQIIILRSRNITDIAAGEETTAFGGGNGIEAYWAPELHYLDNAWFIYFAAQPVGSDIHRMYVLSNDSADPYRGEWSLAELSGMDDKFAIDGTIVENNTGRYFVWSGWEGYENVQQNLYIAAMESPTRVRDEKILISAPDYDWERHGDPKVNEGPVAIIRGRTVNLAYSASGSWTDDYCIGLLTASLDANLSKADSWTKTKTPILRSGNGIYGPGHNSFVESPDGKQTEMIYHSARWSKGGWNRSVRFQTVSFDKNGVLQPITPQYSNQLAQTPSGEPERLRGLPSEFSANSGAVKIVKDAQALSGVAAEGFEDSSQEMSWTVTVPETRNYSIFVWVRMAQVHDESETSSVRISVDGNSGNHEETIYQSQYYQPVVVRRQMKAGKCTVSLAFNSIGNPVSVDRIEIMPSA